LKCDLKRERATVADTPKSDEVPDHIADRIVVLSDAGDTLLAEGDVAGAVEVWTAALAMLSAPHHHSQTAHWLYAAIGDAERQRGRFEAALHAFEQAHASETGAPNPFVLLGLGCCLLDLGRPDAATEPLLRVYRMQGAEIFADEAPQYLQHLRASAALES
jgi:tetratricopeptide (TPR) repeat protein